MWNVLTRRQLIFWWSATRKSIKRHMSSSTQCNWLQCNLIVLWAVSSGASAQTVQRPTAAPPSGFGLHWIHSLPKLYNLRAWNSSRTERWDIS